MTTPENDGNESFQVVVYSDNRRTRTDVLTAMETGRHCQLRVRCIEVATAAALEQRVAAGGIDLAILDAEATPVGGLGLARQLKDEADICPPIVVLIRRFADNWLARWSRAEGTVSYPIDPVRLADVAMPLLSRRQRGAGTAVSVVGKKGYSG